MDLSNHNEQRKTEKEHRKTEPSEPLEPSKQPPAGVSCRPTKVNPSKLISKINPPKFLVRSKKPSAGVSENNRSRTWDLVGTSTGLLCSLKCLLTGALSVLGTASFGVAWMIHLIHSPLIIVPLVSISAFAAVKGLLFPLLDELSTRAKNKAMFYTGLASTAALVMIIATQIFSGLSLSFLHSSIPSGLDSLHQIHNHDHTSHTNLNAIVYDKDGILGLEESTFIYFINKLLHGLLFISSASLSLTHFFKFISSKKK